MYRHEQRKSIHILYEDDKQAQIPERRAEQLNV